MTGSSFRCHICGEKFYDTDALHRHIKSDRKGLHRKRSSRNRLPLIGTKGNY